MVIWTLSWELTHFLEVVLCITIQVFLWWMKNRFASKAYFNYLQWSLPCCCTLLDPFRQIIRKKVKVTFPSTMTFLMRRKRKNLGCVTLSSLYTHVSKFQIGHADVSKCDVCKSRFKLHQVYNLTTIPLLDLIFNLIQIMHINFHFIGCCRHSGFRALSNLIFSFIFFIVEVVTM